MDDTAEQTQEEFCREICLAAKRSGIYAKETRVGEAHVFTFYDVMARKQIAGEANADRKTALEDACHKLTDYLHTAH